MLKKIHLSKKNIKAVIMREKIQNIVVKAVAGTKDITEAIDELLLLYNVSNWVSAKTPPKAGRYLVKTDNRVELAEYEPIYKEWIGNASSGVMRDVKQWAEIPCPI